MNFIYGLLTGIVVSTIVCLLWLRTKNVTPKGETATEPKRDLMEESREKHAEMIAKLEDYIKDKSEVANDEVQNLLQVSDASAERYLQELETQGKIRQIGKVGNQVKYQVL